MARPGIWIFILVGAAAFLQLFSTFLRVYSREYGVTRFITIGREFDARGIGVFRATPKYMGPTDRWGFDGQFYAELALDPLLRDPQLKIALDDPPYRARRILTSWLAWMGGLGKPFWILNVYASLNLVFWIGFAVLLARLFQPYGWVGVGGFAAMLLTCGIIESIHGALTDFPGFTLLALALMMGGAGGAAVLALAALAREPNLLGIVGFWCYRSPWLAAIRKNVQLGLIVALPLALWVAYVASRFPPEQSIAGNNLTWPLWGIMGKLGEFSVHAGNGDIRWSHWYTELFTNEHLHALLTIVAVLTQSVYLFTRREWNNRIWQVGAIFVPYFLCISSIPWESHFTITRHALPITLAFNLVLAMRARRTWLLWFVLGNCFVPYGVYQFAMYAHEDANPAPVECQVILDRLPVPAIKVRFDQGWSVHEWTHRSIWRWGAENHTWRWGVAAHTTVTMVNPTAQTFAVALSFATKSISRRDLKVAVRGVDEWSTPAMQARQFVQTGRFLLPPGETVICFESSNPPVSPGTGGEDRRLSFMLQDLTAELTAVPPQNNSGP